MLPLDVVSCIQYTILGQIVQTKAGPTFIPGQVIYIEGEGERFFPGEVIDTEDGPRFVPSVVIEEGDKVTFIKPQIVQTDQGKQTDQRQSAITLFSLDNSAEFFR